MNERIRELMTQAANASAAYPSGKNNSWETQAIFMEKFAELIVRECATIMDKDVDHPYNSRGSILKYHFGVEE